MARGKDWNFGLEKQLNVLSGTTGSSSRSMEDSGAESNVDYGGRPAEEELETIF